LVAELHFVQRVAAPVFIGPGKETLRCGCGNALVEGYDPGRFLAVAFECGACAAVTVTPALPAGVHPPFAVVVAEPVAEPRTYTLTLPAHAFVVGRAEMDRITALYKARSPDTNTYRLTPDLLDKVVEVYWTYRHGALPEPAAGSGFDGIRDHALGWAVTHLRTRMADAAWSCSDRAETSAAALAVCGFLHFVATWSHHPRFPAMLATAAAAGFSQHGVAPFAAADCLTRLGNRVAFAPEGSRIEAFSLGTGPTETVGVVTEAFTRFEHPFGRPWTVPLLAEAVAERIASVQARINLRNPGILLLSPGTALTGFDEALTLAVREAVRAGGRKNRGLMAVGTIALRMQRLPDPHALNLVYGFFPVANLHYRGESMPRFGG
jgi:hypothetical protein